MDFFAHQEAARKRTSLLLFYYGACVVLLVALTYFAALFTLHWSRVSSVWRPELFLWTTGITVGVIVLGTVWRIIDLRDGGRAVAEMLGGRRVSLNPDNAKERQLRNVVEEIAIASGVPVPEIYVMDSERGLNAFAAGYSHGDMAVAVTHGTLERLTRDELQGVIAHEFSHILNGDMRLNIRLLAVLNGILCIYLAGRIVLEVGANTSGFRTRERAGATAAAFVCGLVLMAIGGLGVFFARVIQAAVSRQREFLADASAVQFTRNPDGIANALKKIGGVPSGSKLRNPQAEAASHFFFSNGISEPWFDLMATHPPLKDRIKRIDPGFNGMFPVLKEDVAPDISSAEIKLRAPLSAAAISALAVAASVREEKIIRRVGQPVQTRYAVGILESLPRELRTAATDALGAAALTFALVLHRSTVVQAKQLQQLHARNTTIAQHVENYAPTVFGLDAQARLPLLNLCLPALRTLSREQWQEFRSALEELICCDAQVDLFEFVLRRIIERNIDAHWKPKAAAVVQYYSFTPLAGDCAVLLSALAHVGHSDSAAVQRAFNEGAAKVPVNLNLPLIPADGCGVDQIDAALTRLVQSVPHIKKTVLEACALAVACDGEVKAEEAELLRAIAESLGCPIPPFVEGV